jgi:HK97 family phage portal protein
VPGRLKDRQKFTEEFNKAYGSVENAHKTLVIDDGAKWVATTIPPDDAQFLETRKFQRSEIAAIYRVPPHLIGDLERATFSNIEHQSLEFIQYSMLPWMTRFEQEFNRKLLGDGYFCRFLVAALLRGDMKSRYEAYNTGLRAGFLNQDEVRELEEMNPIPGGDVYRVQAQMVPLTQLDGGEQ